jgi:hypothetical protein
MRKEVERAAVGQIRNWARVERRANARRWPKQMRRLLPVQKLWGFTGWGHREFIVLTNGGDAEVAARLFERREGRGN